MSTCLQDLQRQLSQIPLLSKMTLFRNIVWQIAKMLVDLNYNTSSKYFSSTGARCRVLRLLNNLYNFLL